MTITLADSYKIFPEMTISSCEFAELQAYIAKKEQNLDKYGNATYPWLVDARNRLKNEVKTLLSSTRGTITMKMLLVHEDGNEHHFNEMAKACNIPNGNDIDCYRSLIDRGMIAFSSKHSRGSKYYKITDFGKFIIRIIKTNDVFYRCARWFKNQDEDSIYKNMLNSDVNTNECALDDISAESVLNMVKALLDLSSDIHKIGSACKWMNTFMYLLKSSKEFYGYVDIPEVNAWLDANANLNYATKQFYPKWKRIQKKWKSQLTKPKTFDAIDA